MAAQPCVAPDNAWEYATIKLISPLIEIPTLKRLRLLLLDHH
jgi:hypothetical protein